MGGHLEALLALAGTVFGGVGLKIIESILGRAKRRDDTATILRSELRKDLHDLREELREAEECVDEWRGKYYELLARAVAHGVPIIE